MELRKDIKVAILQAAAAGPLGAVSTAADVTGIAVSWGGLLLHVAKYYGYTMNRETAKKLCASMLMGMGGYYFGCKTATKLFDLIPGAGTLAGMGVSSLENIIFTYRFAQTLVIVFDKGKVDFSTLNDSVVTMFAGTGKGLRSIREIVSLCTSKNVAELPG